MPVSIQLVVCTPAFERYWDELAARLEVGIERLASSSQITGGPGRVTILSCGGDEAGAAEHVTRVLAAGGVDPIVVGTEPDHRLAVRLIRIGAGSYYALPGDAALFEADLADLISRDAITPAPAAAGYDFSSLVGEHPDFLAAIQHVSKVIPAAGTTVLIMGETGTGKELFARAIHDNGPRAHGPFIAINCSAIPANLLEAELFGHAKGAFTGATANRPGLVEAASGGTLFLDEISAMPVELQGKLLRFLEERESRRLGEVRTRTVDVRVLAAANLDLRAAIERGDFRQDLYFRLAVLPMTLPPLRERGEDTVLLARHFVSKFSETYGVPVRPLSGGATKALRGHLWPGNVRELRNAIERALLLCHGDRIEASDLGLEDSVLAPGRTSGAENPLPFPATLDQLEEAAALAMLERCRGNKSDAARRLGITRSRLYRLLERADPDRRAPDTRR
ncbi:MAG: sigma-54 dependent transcriptional regulator [Gemmatimonadota bacterium]|nr:sigma-54 dependent transcriptional regulator [Gemmatimonadota bacterium]